jgi:tRNA G18 (ribose-2'-O)-methylase SpoU
VRNCAAFGVQALFVGETCSSPYLRRAVRNSMGTVFKLPVMECTDLAQSLQDLRTMRMRCIAAHLAPDNRYLSRTNFAGDCCVVFGSEGFGISPRVLAACDENVVIPMANEVDSLNVSAAAAVFLYEVRRQRE